MTTNHNFNSIDDKLDEALARLAFGAPLELILAEAGDDAEQLRPLLEIASQVASLKSAIPIPPPDASLQKLLAHGQKLAGPASSPAAAPPGWLTSVFNIFNGGFRLATALATAMLLLLVISGTVYLAAQRSLPGDALYRLKQAGEQVQLDLAGDSLRREQLSQRFNQQRRTEVEALLEQGKSAKVTLEGQIQAVNAAAIVLDGLTVQLGPETEIVGQPTAGAGVRVEVRTLPPTGLLALTLTVIEPGPPPTPAPTSSPTPTFTAQPTPTLPKVQATDTLPPTATPPKAQATDSISLPPTPSPTAKPTEPPLTEDNLNDNSLDDNVNQNSDDNLNDNSDNSNENTDFDDDNFNDNSDEFDDEERDSNSNDNGGDDNSNDDDHSGSDDGSNDNSDDNSDNSDDDGSSNDDDDNSGDDDDNDDND